MNRPLVLFDGVCNLCNGSVQFIIHRDKKGIFQFASLQSDVAHRILGEHLQLSSPGLSTVILLLDGKIFTKSEAVLQIARLLGGVWKLWLVLRIVPRPLRDMIYDWVARSRYRLFGKRETCSVPLPEWRDRFLNA